MARHHSQSAHQAASASASGLRSRFDDSWVEVSSRPSSSSLSSVGDEVITTGLRIQQSPTTNRRHRRMRRSLPDDARLGTQSHVPTVSSSQEEYDESESESDPVLSSSSEEAQIRSSEDDVQRSVPTASRQISYASEDGDVDDDDEENATAVGTVGNAVFTPQPSAFSHPPRLSRHNSTSGPASRSRRPSATHQRHSFSAQQHSPYSMVSPSHHLDHDAALRASLSTLLSYAAATRGGPKPKSNQRQYESHSPSNRVQPTTISLMPESMAFPDSKDERPQSDNEDKGKRKTHANNAGHGRSDSKDRRASKKRRGSTYPVETITALEGISPTLLTWVVGAGMIVLVSAISFSAGYVVGRETGHAEAAASFTEVGADAVKRQFVAAKGSGLGLRRIAAGAAVGAAA